MVCFTSHRNGLICSIFPLLQPLEHLEKLAQEVYLPILSNPLNQEGWGEVASKEIMDRFHSFLANISITVGQTKVVYYTFALFLFSCA